MDCNLRRCLLPLTVLLCVLCSGACAAPSQTAISATSAAEAAETATSAPGGTATALRLINPMGPAVIPAVGMASGAVTGDVAVEVTYWKTTDEAIGLLAAGEAQFAVLPVTAAANMRASGIDIAMLAVHEWRAFYLVAASGSPFGGWDSLVGKTVYTPEAKGQTVDVLTRYALAANGIVPDEQVTFVYAPAQEIVALFGEGRIQYAALPEPYVTMVLAAGDGTIVLDYQDYWAKATGSDHGIPIAGLFVTTDFLAEHPNESEAVAQLLAASTEWANANPDAAIEASAAVLPLEAGVVREALTRLGFESVPANAAKDEVLRFLAVVRETYPEGVKAVPDDSFFAGS